MINNNPNWCNDPLTLIGIVGTGSLERGLRCSYQRMLQKIADALISHYVDKNGYLRKVKIRNILVYKKGTMDKFSAFHD